MDLKKLPTEQRNPDTAGIDEVSTLEMLRMINNEDKKVAHCVEAHLPQIAAAIDAVAEKFIAGGHHGLHPHEGGNRSKAGAQYALHRGHGEKRQGLLQPDGEPPPEQ